MSPDSAFASLSGADIALIRSALHFSYAQFAIALSHYDPLFSYTRISLWWWEHDVYHVPTRAARVILAYARSRGIAV